MERVESALGLQPKKGVREWTHDHKLALGIFLGTVALIVGTVALIVIGYFAWWQPQWKQHEDTDLADLIDNRIDAKLASHHFDDLTGDVKTLKGQMGEISGYLKILVTDRLKTVSSLPPAEFERHLPEATALLNTARITKAKTAPNTIANVRSRLARSNHDNPQFWGAAAPLVNYRSVGDKQQEFPPCDLKHHPMGPLAENVPAGATSFKMNPVPFRGCEIQIDSPEAQQLYLRDLRLIDLVFENCRIVYRGGPLIFPGTAVPGRTTMSLVFKDCLFDLSVPGVPPQDGGAVVGGLLLAKDLHEVSMTISIA